MGKSGRAMLAALVAGTTDAAALAQLAKGQLREKRPALERALAGRVGPHQRFLLAEQLTLIDQLDASIDRVSAEIAERLRPREELLARLETIPGVGRRTAELLLAEIGTDMRRFPTAAHLASWAGMCPGNNASAGRRLSGKTRTGSPWLRAAFVEAARAAARTKATQLSALYHRLAVRRGAKQAAVAVGHRILVTAYHLLQDGGNYRELDFGQQDERRRQLAERRLVRRLAGLGYRATLQPVA
jgi:transposase